MAHYNDHTSLIVLGSIMICLIALAFTMRCICHVKYASSVELDYILIIPAVVITVGLGIALVMGAQVGIIGGNSTANMPPKQFAHIGKLEYAIWISHPIAIGLIKLSILFYFRRLFKGVIYMTTFDMANWTLILFVTLWTLLFSCLSIFACGTDPAASWSTAYWLEHKCMDTFAMMAASAASDWLIDLAILVEPLIMIHCLRLALKTRIQTTIIFLLSIFAVVAGLMRMVVWIQVNIGGAEKTTYVLLGSDYSIHDYEAIASVGFFWTYLEISVALIVACSLPSARVVDLLTIEHLVHQIQAVASYATSYAPSCLGRKRLRRDSEDIVCKEAVAISSEMNNKEQV